jgi:pimeloyl-ACP methyl ester carboxylesterase
MGAGFGGWVALELALLAPRSLRSLVLVAPYGVKLFGRMEPDFQDLLLLDAREQVEVGWADPRRCRGIRMPGFPESPDDAQHAHAFAERATLARYGWKPFMHSRRLTRWFHTIDTPTLVVSGSRDRMVREGHSALLASRMPNAVHVEIPDAGHYPYLEQPERFQEAVLDFYARLEEDPR